jgi:hypothetical protein
MFKMRWDYFDGLGPDITSDFMVFLEIYLKMRPFGANISYLLMFRLGYINNTFH